MSGGVILDPGYGGATLLTDQVAGVDAQVVKLGVSAPGVTPVQVSAANPLPVSIPGTVPITGTVAVSNFPGTQAVSATTPLPATVQPRAMNANAPVATTAGTSSAVVLAANAARKGCVIVNLSTGNVSLGLDGQAAVLSAGITLTPNGAYTMDAYSFSVGAIAAVASVAASALSIQEWQ